MATLLADGLEPAESAEAADLVVVNTCAFVEAARQESIDTVLALSESRKDGAKLVVTGCLAERYGSELADALPEADAVVGFAGEGGIAGAVGMAAGAAGVPVGMPTLRVRPAGVTDLLDLPRPAPSAPWAYVKVAEGCDRNCAFCAIPTFRGKQRSRTPDSIEAEVRDLVNAGVAEIVLVAQDLAWYGRDAGEPGSLAPLLRRLDPLSADGLARVRLLYLYPSEVRDPLVSTMLELPTVVPYFDLSLQHADAALLRRMKRWGSGDRFLAAIDAIRAAGAERRVPLVVHRRLPRRGGAGARGAALVPRRRGARLGRLLLVLPGGRHRRRVVARRARRVARRRAAARVRGGAGTDHARRCATRSSARRSRCWSTRSRMGLKVPASSDVRTARRRRSTASCTSKRSTRRPGAIVRAHVTEAIGPDLVAKAAAQGERVSE